MTHLTGEQILANAIALGPDIERVADDIERNRRLPDQLIDDMRAAGVFRIAFPKAWGGPECDLVQQSQMVESLAYFDASTAWVAMICSDSGHYAARLDEDVALELYPNLDMLTSGFVIPAGTAVEDGDSYRVSGHWQFGSGCLHADRIIGGCFVHDTNGMKFDESGMPEFRAVWLPNDAITIHDTWHTTGLAGSGSNDYSVADVIVPRSHSFRPMAVGSRPEPLYRYSGAFFTNLPPVAIGCAQRMIDDLRDLAVHKVTMPAMVPMKSEYRVQIALAEATAAIAATRAYHYSVLSSLWQTLSDSGFPSQQQRADIIMMSVHAVQTAVTVSEMVCEVVGGAAVYRSNPFDRRRRDIATVSAHMIGQRKTLVNAAQLLFGDEPRFSLV